ncbi:potassium channel family protein [Portibacter marinus]|uniref:potassium channel family protein n=1 Tax=Portibacter marinus TaxID=2898660 RepID=UPI001F1A6C13|nr:potassium channel family protein [Portibacter marinus]
MNTFQEKQKRLEEYNRIEYESIISNSQLSVQELWSLSEINFLKWRAKYDLPRIIKHFEENLQYFKEWKYENGITRYDFLKVMKLSPFLEDKHPEEKDRRKYYYKQTIAGAEVRYIISEDVLNPTYERDGKTETFERYNSFVPFLEWVRKVKKLNINLVGLTGISAPSTEYEIVRIHSGLALLNMNAKVQFLKPKFIEFANLSNLELAENIVLQSSLEFHFCFADNLSLSNIQVYFHWYFFSKICNIKIKDSSLISWKFINTEVNGFIENSMLKAIGIHGGKFEPYVKNVIFDGVRADTIHYEGNNLTSTYRLLKYQYNSQGDDDLAYENHILEESEKIRGYSFRYSTLKWLTGFVNKYYWKFGSKPQFILYYSIIIIVTFALVFYICESKMFEGKSLVENSFLECLYLSLVTFTTLGADTTSFSETPKLLFGLESILGVLNFGFLIAGYSKSKY